MTDRILVSAHTYQPEGVSEGFTSAQLVSSLRRRGYRVTVLTSALRRPIRGYGVLSVRCKTNADVPYLPLANYVEFMLRSIAMVRPQRAKFSLIHHVSPIVIRLPSILGVLRRPFIWGPVGGSVPYPPGFEAYGRPSNAINALRLLDRPRMHIDPTMRFTLASADRIVVTASSALNLIPDKYKSKVVVIPEGIPQGSVLTASAGEEPYILSSGRLVDYKAADLAIRAFARIRADGVRLIITGDGPKRNEFLELIEKLGVGARVQMLGRVSREENHRLMSRSLFCVFPALREAFGHVNLEAMAAWKPVIATDWGGPHDLIEHGVTGLKVLGRNPDEHVEMLAEAMEQLLGSADLRRRMGAAAAKCVIDRFTWPALGDRYESLYREIIG